MLCPTTGQYTALDRGTRAWRRPTRRWHLWEVDQLPYNAVGCRLQTWSVWATRQHLTTRHARAGADKASS